MENPSRLHIFLGKKCRRWLRRRACAAQETSDDMRRLYICAVKWVGWPAMMTNGRARDVAMWTAAKEERRSDGEVGGGEGGPEATSRMMW